MRDLVAIAKFLVIIFLCKLRALDMIEPFYHGSRLYATVSYSIPEPADAVLRIIDQRSKLGTTPPRSGLQFTTLYADSTADWSYKGY